MIALVAILIAFPLGFFCKSRLAAFVAYIALFAHVYTFQTANLVMEWVNGSAAAFPQNEPLGASTLSYLAVTSAIYAVGFGLVWGGQVVRTRRSRRTESIDLAAA